MARIPDQARVSAPRTPAADYARGRVTDLGLGDVARGLQDLAARKQKQADDDAVAAYGQVQTAWTATYKPAAETYDGREPGFAAAQMDAYDAHAAEVAATITDEDTRRSFERVNQRGRLAAFDEAVGVEAERSGKRVRETRERAQQLRLVSGLAGVQATWTSQKVEALQAYTGEQEGFADQLMASFDEVRDAAIANASEEDRPLVELALANYRADEQLKIMAFEAQTRASWETQTVSNTLDTLVAQVTSDASAYDTARASGVAAVEALGGERAVRLKPKVEQSIAVAMFSGMASRDEHARILEMLDSGDWDERLGDAKPQIYASASAKVNSEADQLAAVTGQNRLQAEVASIANTGVSTGFDPSEFTSLGPAAVAEARNKIAQARLVFDATRGMDGLSAADRARRVEALKPKPGDPDFANKQAAYEMAAQQSAQAAQRQLADPAAATQADPNSAALWRSFQADPGNTAAASVWAMDTLIRQAALGVPESQRRILPKAEARRIAETYSKLDRTDAPGRTNALVGIAAYAEQFGPNAGRVVRELQANGGLTASDAALLNLAADGQGNVDPLLVGRYTRAIARQATQKPEKAEDDALRARLQRNLQPFVSSYAGQDGAAFADQVNRIAWTIGRAELLDGASPNEAAATAQAAVTSHYVVENGIRIPRSQLQRTVQAVAPRAASGPDALARATKPQGQGGRPLFGPMSGAALYMEGARRIARDLLLTYDGANVTTTGVGLSAAGSDLRSMTEAQRRVAYADVVAHNGRWVTTADDSGLMLVVPDPRGGVVPVLDKDAQPVRRTWAQLQARVGRP